MSSLKNKLYNYEQTPPPKVWDAIAAALDESHISDAFPSTLYNAVATPPSSAWDKIAGSLDAEQSPVIPMRRKTRILFRYAAAVAAIAIITFGIIKWTRNSDIPTAEDVTVSKDHSAPDNATVLPGENSVVKTSTGKEDLYTEDNNAHTESINSVKSPAGRKIKKAAFAVSNTPGAMEPAYAYNEHTPNLADRYIMLMTPNGIIRMSKKLGDIVCCVTGEEQNEDCKDQVKKWQEKLAASPVAAPGNFMDILSLVSSLNETEL
jgi:hypothetical protein